jgi:hypothetical protein
MFPPTSLAPGLPAAHLPAVYAQRIEAKEKRCGEENRHLRFSSLRLRLEWKFDCRNPIGSTAPVFFA